MNSNVQKSVEAQAAPLIVGLGEVLWDVISPTEKYLGGAPANFAFHSSQFGANGLVVSGIGTDALGQEITAQLQGKGLDTTCLRQDARHPTGTVTVQKDAQGQPTYNIHAPVAWDFLPFDDLLRQQAENADAVCFGTLAQRSPASRAAIRAFVASTRPDCLRVFDINLRQAFYTRDVIESSLKLCNVLKLNHEELPVVAALLELPANNSADETALLTSLLALYPLRLIALTRGGNGSVLTTKFRRSEHPGYPATVVDTVGAGDAFTAALTWGLLHTADLDHIHDTASRLASFVCSQPGGTPQLPPSLRTQLAPGRS